MDERSRGNVKVEPRSTSFLSYFKTLSISLVPGHPILRESKTVLDSGFHTVDSGLQVIDSSLCQWNLDSGFQLLVGFRFFKLCSGFQSPGFQISPAKFSLDSGFYKQKFPRFRHPDSLTRENPRIEPTTARSAANPTIDWVNPAAESDSYLL